MNEKDRKNGKQGKYTKRTTGKGAGARLKDRAPRSTDLAGSGKPCEVGSTEKHPMEEI